MRTPFGYSDSGHVNTNTHAHVNSLFYNKYNNLFFTIIPVMSW